MSEQKALIVDVDAEAGKKGNITMRKQLLAGVVAAFGLAAVAAPANATLFMKVFQEDTIGSGFGAGSGATEELSMEDGVGNPLDSTLVMITQQVGQFNLTVVTSNSEVPGDDPLASFQTSVLGQIRKPGVGETFDARAIRIVTWETEFTKPEGPLSINNSQAVSAAYSHYLVDWSSWIGPITDGPGVPSAKLHGALEGYGDGNPANNGGTLSPSFPFDNDVGGIASDGGTVLGYQIVHIFDLIPCTDGTGLCNGAAVGNQTSSIELINFTQTTTIAVPEPATLGILGMGLLGLGAARRRRNRKAA